MSTSPCKVTDPRKLESAATEWKWLHCSAMGCESGRQDSNLRPLVPQTSPHFHPQTRVQKEWFRRELVGMTTRAGAMDSIGIPSTRPHAYWALLPSPTALHFAAGGRRARRASEAHGSGDTKLCAREIPHPAAAVSAFSIYRMRRILTFCPASEVGADRGRSGPQHSATAEEWTVPHPR